MSNNVNQELDYENNEEQEGVDIYADLENNIENAKNQINQVKNKKYQEQENSQESQEEQINENENSLEDQNNNIEDDEDDRLTYTLITLDLGDLIHIFEENNISFVDMLLLSKEDLKELQLKLYQRNRIHNFSVLFNKYAKNYSISEISDFFSFNPKFIFNSSIYDRVIMSQNQNDIWNNDTNIKNENIDDNNEEESNEYNEENNNDNINEDNININNTQKERYDLDNINYSDYMNYMNKENNNNLIKNNDFQLQQRTYIDNINDRLENNINNNTKYNDIKYNTFNNNNYNNNYYLSTDYQIKQAQNTIQTNFKELNTTKNKSKPLINKGVNNTKNISNKNNSKKEKPIIQVDNKIIIQPKEQKSKLLLNKKPNQPQFNTANNTTNIFNSNINNNITNTNKLPSNKKKSSNKINAVINKYLEIKQDADEFLEKLNKKKTETQNKYNKYNLLIKKKNVITKINEPNYNLNIQNNPPKNKIINKSPNKSAKFEEYKQLVSNYQIPNNNNINQEFDLNSDINSEYQKMNNQIEEFEKINLDFNSKNHLEQIKQYINEKGENINLDDINKINNELIKMIEIINKKEKLKQTLENYNFKIEQNKQLLNELNELDNNENQENLENKVNNDIYENQLNYNYNNINNNINNQYLDEVEEEYDNEMQNKLNKII